MKQKIDDFFNWAGNLVAELFVKFMEYVMSKIET